MDNIEVNDEMRMRTNTQMRTDVKRIFGAGESIVHNLFSSQDKYHSETVASSLDQGATAALNVLALSIPFHMLPFSNYNFFGKTFFAVGHQNVFSDFYIDGSLKDMSFIAYYGVGDSIVSAFGSPNKKYEMSVIREAIRLHLLPPLSKIKGKTIDIDKLAEKIRVKQLKCIQRASQEKLLD